MRGGSERPRNVTHKSSVLRQANKAVVFRGTLLDKVYVCIKLSGHKIFQWFVLVLVVFIVSDRVPELMNWINQPIKRVEVDSTFHNITHQEIRDGLQNGLKSRFFQLDLEGIRTDLRAIPWIKNVSIRRQWPDLLQVTIEEQQAVARWGELQLISNDSVVFSPVDVAKFHSMPVLIGSKDKASEVMQQYLAISLLLRPLGLTLTMLERSDSGAWWFKAGHVAVNLGRDRKMERLQRFVRLYYSRLESNWEKVGRVDLRYLNGASVAWSGSGGK